jgi:hypothetical protein
MPPPTANEIKTQLATLLTPVIATSGTKKAKIIEQLAFAFRADSGEDPSNLRSDLDTVSIEGGGTIQRINCLMISEESFSQTPPPEDAVRSLTQARGRNRITRRFRLTYFYQMGEGSENVASANVELIRTTINSAPKLGFQTVVNMKAGPAEFIEGHDKVQMPSFAPDAFGMVLVHVAEMLLTLRLIEPLEGT